MVQQEQEILDAIVFLQWDLKHQKGIRLWKGALSEQSHATPSCTVFSVETDNKFPKWLERCLNVLYILG
jgi:hypothetical protein